MVTINYANLTGIHNEVAPIVFASLFVPLAIINLVHALRSWTFTRFKITLFCMIRIGAYVLRALLAAKTSVATNETAFIVYSVLLSIGFYPLLDSTYALVIDREDLDAYTPPPGPLAIISRIVRTRKLTHAACIAAVALGVTGAINATSDSASDRANSITYRKAATIIFLVVTALLAVHTVMLVWSGVSLSYAPLGPGRSRSSASSATDVAIADPVLQEEQSKFGARHDIQLLAVIVLLLLAREVFSVATISQTKINEALWFIFVASTELLVVCVFVVPGLLPSRRAVKAAARAKAGSGAQEQGYAMKPEA